MTQTKHQAKEFTAHIKEMTKDYGIRIATCPKQQTQMARTFTENERELSGANAEIVLHHFPIISQKGYAVALHELGHLLSPGQGMVLPSDNLAMQLGDKSMLSVRSLFNELDAWFWAHLNALTWTSSMDRIERLSLKTYGDTAKWREVGLKATFTGKLNLPEWYKYYGLTIQAYLQKEQIPTLQHDWEGKLSTIRNTVRKLCGVREKDLPQNGSV